jgi:hypothetical protein
VAAAPLSATTTTAVSKSLRISVFMFVSGAPVKTGEML